MINLLVVKIVVNLSTSSLQYYIIRGEVCMLIFHNAQGITAKVETNPHIQIDQWTWVCNTL